MDFFFFEDLRGQRVKMILVLKLPWHTHTVSVGSKQELFKMREDMECLLRIFYAHAVQKKTRSAFSKDICSSINSIIRHVETGYSLWTKKKSICDMCNQ